MRTGTIDTEISKYFVRYDRLKMLMDEAFEKIDGNHIDIYIDLASVFRSVICSNKTAMNNKTDIAVSILNMCGHYRHFFRSKYHITSNIYLIGNHTGFYTTPKSFDPMYNAEYIQKAAYANKMLLSDIIAQNINLLKEIVLFIQGIYYIDIPEETSAIITFMMDNTVEVPSLIISRDILNAMFPIDRRNSVLLYPSKRFELDGVLDDSVAISPYVNRRGERAIDLFMKLYRPKLQTRLPDGVELIFSVPYIMGSCGYDKRGIKRMKNITTFIKEITQQYSTITTGIHGELNSSIIKNFVCLRGSETTDLSILNNIKCFDPSVACANMRNDPTVGFKIQRLDLYDPEGLKKVLEQLATNNPVNLNLL